MSKSVALVMVGGPTKGTQFRPLSLEIPMPFFPIAGKPMVYHSLVACKRVPNLSKVFLVGFYDVAEFSKYSSQISEELHVPVRYLKEQTPNGSAGAIHKFKDIIMESSPDYLFVINIDVACAFPLAEMLEMHTKHGRLGTLLTKRVPAEVASRFGEMVVDDETTELLHYVEKPGTFVSDRINCGVYVFSADIFYAVERVLEAKRETGMKRVSSFGAIQSVYGAGEKADFVRLDQDILTPLAGKQQLYCFETDGFWDQMKSPGMAVKTQGNYLQAYATSAPHLLASDGPGMPTIEGHVYIHPSATVHPTAKLGPNVSIAANASIGPGVRISNCIILDDVVVQDNACIMYAILGWKSVIGRWARVMGSGKYEEKLGITILAENVIICDEVVLVNSIVLPHKQLNTSVHNDIIL
eukprot:jgi/Mesvir1/6419/Mv19510-RA.1